MNIIALMFQFYCLNTSSVLMGYRTHKRNNFSEKYDVFCLVICNLFPTIYGTEGSIINGC